MSSEEDTKSVSPDPALTSKKRKVKFEEIEVNEKLPEPPSKKAKRLLKKGKPLPVKPDSGDEGDDGAAGKTGKEKSKRSEYGVWIGNLPWTLTRTDLFKWLMESSGGVITEESIKRVNLPTSKHSGARDSTTHPDRARPQNKGFAYVDFDNEAAAVAAMALTETEIEGRKVLIKSSTSFDGRPQVQKTETGDTGANRAEAKGTPANTSKKIYVGNLGFQTTEDDLWWHFEKCGEIDWVKVATFEDSGKCKGYGWVKFKEVEAADWAAKGFVRIKEEIPTEDDFRESEDGQEPAEKKFKTRKWWVNKLKGRELKIEFAEDDQVRYKKRYGKDAPARKQEIKEGEAATGVSSESKENPQPRKPVTAKAKGYGESSVKSYLTGSVVQPEGKRVTFD